PARSPAAGRDGVQTGDGRGEGVVRRGVPTEGLVVHLRDGGRGPARRAPGRADVRAVLRAPRGEAGGPLDRMLGGPRRLRGGVAAPPERGADHPRGSLLGGAVPKGLYAVRKL